MWLENGLKRVIDRLMAQKCHCWYLIGWKNTKNDSWVLSVEKKPSPYFRGDGNSGLRAGIVSLQKSLLRIIAASNNPISHTDPLFAKLAILKMDDLFAQRIRIFSYKLSRNLLPIGVSSLFDRISHNHRTRGASSNLYVARSDGKSIRSIAPKHWNSLPSDLRNSPSISSFRDGSKRGLLAPYSAFVCSVAGCPSCSAAPAWWSLVGRYLAGQHSLSLALSRSLSLSLSLVLVSPGHLYLFFWVDICLHRWLGSGTDFPIHLHIVPIYGTIIADLFCIFFFFISIYGLYICSC